MSGQIEIVVDGIVHRLDRRSAIALNKRIAEQLRAQDALRSATAAPADKYPLTVLEEGGAGTNTGSATVWCGPNGERLPLAPGCTPGGYSCAAHATLLAPAGSHRIVVDWSRKNQFPFSIAVYREEEEDAVWTGVTAHSAPAHLHAAIEAALEKSQDYHCRSAYYYAPAEEDVE